MTSATPDSEHWRLYYEVTVDRPAWETVRIAIANFALEGPSAGRFAVDLGCGAGRDARELLRAGWRVLAVDRESSGLRILKERIPVETRVLLETQVEDLADFEVPPADLVNANLSLPFLPEQQFWAAWQRVMTAIQPGGRVSAMVFGDRDEGVGDAQMTFVSPRAFRASLEPEFEIEHWVDLEEDTTTALGEPHHIHRIDVVARRVRSQRGPTGPVPSTAKRTGTDT
jgi:tellurite methyltransferase